MRNSFGHCMLEQAKQSAHLPGPAMIAAHGKAPYSTSRRQTGETKRRSCGSWARFPTSRPSTSRMGRPAGGAGIAEVMATIANTHPLAPISTSGKQCGSSVAGRVIIGDQCLAFGQSDQHAGMSCGSSLTVTSPLRRLPMAPGNPSQ